MGREQRRKQEKNYKHKIKENEEQNIFSISTTIKIIVVVAIILVALYFVLAIFVTKEINVFDKKTDTESSETTDSNNNTTSNVSNKILATNTFNQQEDSYYVYYYDFDDENEEISTLINNINETVYRVDTSSSLNKNYVSDSNKGNSNAKKLEDLKVINPTIIKVENDTITSYYEGVNSIVGFLNK